MKKTAMSRTLQLGDTQVDETKLADLCERYFVRELSSFGSACHREMRPDSDILVEFLPDANIDLMDYASLMLDLSRLLGRKVDLQAAEKGFDASRRQAKPSAPPRIVNGLQA